jgi:phosphoglycolate phosphatase
MLVVFDWDGTLIDSAGKIVNCMQRAAEDLQLEILPGEIIRQIIGLGLPEAIATLYPDEDPGVIDPFMKRYSGHFVEADQVPCDFFPEVMSTLESMHGRGYHLAVATGKSRRGLNRVLGNLEMENFFHFTRCADETRSKPHPRMLLEILGESGYESDRAVMVGDTTFDMEMAREAGMHRIAVSYGAHSTENLEQFSPAGVVHHFPEILNIIDRLAE